MARYLGVDYGLKRIGLAISDADGKIASPLAVVERKASLAEQVRDVLQAADEFGFDSIVVGIPHNMDGSDGPQAALTRKFASALAAGSGVVIHEWDERLSSRAADELMAGRLTRQGKKARRDALAAQIILQGYLDSLATPP